MVEKKMSCALEITRGLSVKMANGELLTCSIICRGFNWSMQDYVLTTDVLILNLGGFELVLGIQWLETLGNIV
uniref:RVP_2 domain-containing protein n=1 Tax=Nelumbo nucifera TaxID=4432 RepID=A0A822Y7B3_NELNU|nr:TPA_asm: hypothetical protein HUJ06_031362 [Nelumbo nucifera]